MGRCSFKNRKSSSMKKYIQPLSANYYIKYSCYICIYNRTKVVFNLLDQSLNTMKQAEKLMMKSNNIFLNFFPPPPKQKK